MQFANILIAALASTTALASPTHRASGNSVDERATGNPTDSNCNGWGSIRRSNDVNAALGQIPPGSGENGQQCADPHSCHMLTCYNGVRMGFCNDNDYGKCVWNDDLKQRISQELDLCHSTNDGNYAGQAFYSDSTNIIVQPC